MPLRPSKWVGMYLGTLTTKCTFIYSTYPIINYRDPRYPPQAVRTGHACREPSVVSAANAAYRYPRVFRWSPHSAGQGIVFPCDRALPTSLSGVRHNRRYGSAWEQNVTPERTYGKSGQGTISRFT
jgi:hypothetical protein